MHRIFGKGTVLLKIGLVMAIIAMVIVCPLSRATLQAQDEAGLGDDLRGGFWGWLAGKVLDYLWDNRNEIANKSLPGFEALADAAPYAPVVAH